MKCCICKKDRPKDWRAQNWTGVKVGNGKSHWSCNDHPDIDVIFHARDVAEKGAICAVNEAR